MVMAPSPNPSSQQPSDCEGAGSNELAPFLLQGMTNHNPHPPWSHDTNMTAELSDEISVAVLTYPCVSSKSKYMMATPIQTRIIYQLGYGVT